MSRVTGNSDDTLRALEVTIAMANMTNANSRLRQLIRDRTAAYQKRLLAGTDEARQDARKMAEQIHEEIRQHVAEEVAAFIAEREGSWL